MEQPNKHLSSEECLHMEDAYSAHNYHPMPVVFSQARGVYVWDPEGRRYYDFLSAYSAVNQGHCHPKIILALMEQAQRLTLSSRAFYNDQFCRWAKYVTEFFGYERVLPMNTGAEAVETALKVCRKWGYEKKKIPKDQAIIISANECFHGRTLGVISMSTDPDCYNGFGPFVGGMVKVPFNDIPALEKALEENGPRVAGFLVEPIQGEAGVFVPDDGYLKKAFDLCHKHNALFIADEVQTGIARTGRLLACDWENVHPDIVIMGKALSGGVLPVSCIVTSNEIMSVIKPGEHGSTFGGNPMAAAVSIAALQVIKDEHLTENADILGKKFREKFMAMKSPIVETIRGKGLLNAFVIKPFGHGLSAMDLCLLLKSRGLLCKPTHENIIRLAPPLVITEAQLDECIAIIQGALKDIVNMKRSDIPGADVYYGAHH